MIEIDKLLEGLECCMKADCGCNGHTAICPYYTGKPGCVYALMKDTFDVLSRLEEDEVE